MKESNLLVSNSLIEVGIDNVRRVGFRVNTECCFAGGHFLGLFAQIGLNLFGVSYHLCLPSSSALHFFPDYFFCPPPC
jgi:hypothetical protein